MHLRDGMNVLSEEKNSTDEVYAVISVFGDCSVRGTTLFVLLCLLCSGIAQSQVRPLQTITYTAEFTAAAEYTHHTTIEYSDRKRLDVVVYDQKKMSLNILVGDGTGAFSRILEIATISSPASITVGKINGDTRDDIVVVQRELNRILVFMSNEVDTTFRSITVPAGYYPEHAVIGDLNGDGISDIMTYGRLSAGVSVILGKGKGVFSEPQTIFPSIPIDGISIINLNADRIPDLVIRKWLSNEDCFYFGLGNLQYSEQTTFSYGSDTTVTVCADLNNDNITDIVVASLQMNSILIYHGDGLGNWVRVQNNTCQFPIGAVTLSAVSSTGFPDILVTSAGVNQVSIIVNKKNGYYYDEIIFGLPYEQCSVVMTDINGDGHTDILTFDRYSRRYSVLWNSRTMMREENKNQVAVGISPANIALIDLNSDGFDDIIVTNTLSNTLSLLMGSAEGSLEYLSVETAEAPTQAVFYSRSDSGITVLTVHAEKSGIGLLTMNTAGTEGSFAFRDVDLSTIPLSGTPSSVLPDLSMDQNSISLYVFSKSIPNGITFYRQIQATKFIAKSLTLQVPSRIIFATIGDMNKDGITDLVYIYNDKKSKRDFLGTTLNDTEGNFAGKSFSFVLPDTGMTKAFVYIEDLNGDQCKDAVLYDHGRKRLHVIVGNADGSFSTRIPCAENVDINDLNHLQIIDYDMDGVNDIVVLRSDTRSIELFRGKGNGSFSPGVRILEGFQISSFRCGDVNGDGRIDIVYIVSKENAIRIQYGK